MKLIVILAYVVLASATCFLNCPSNPEFTGKVFSVKPPSLIKEIVYTSDKDACCNCAVDCEATWGCVQTQCGGFQGFTGRTNCQLFKDSALVPDATTKQKVWWGRLGTNCTTARLLWRMAEHVHRCARPAELEYWRTYWMQQKCDKPHKSALKVTPQ